MFWALEHKEEMSEEGEKNANIVKEGKSYQDKWAS